METSFFLELSRNRRNFNIITNYTQSYIQLFPIQYHSLVKENSMKGNIHRSFDFFPISLLW